MLKICNELQIKLIVVLNKGKYFYEINNKILKIKLNRKNKNNLQNNTKLPQNNKP